MSERADRESDQASRRGQGKPGPGSEGARAITGASERPDRQPGPWVSRCRNPARQGGRAWDSENRVGPGERRRSTALRRRNFAGSGHRRRAESLERFQPACRGARTRVGPTVGELWLRFGAAAFACRKASAPVYPVHNVVNGGLRHVPALTAPLKMGGSEV
jgi:hypothetical protein